MTQDNRSPSREALQKLVNAIRVTGVQGTSNLLHDAVIEADAALAERPITAGVERIGASCKMCGMAAPEALAKTECHRPDCPHIEQAKASSASSERAG